MKESSIVLKMNGSTDALIVDGIVFDRSVMTAQQRRGLRDMVREGLFPIETMESRAPRRHRRTRSAR